MSEHVSVRTFKFDTKTAWMIAPRAQEAPTLWTMLRNHDNKTKDKRKRRVFHFMAAIFSLACC